MPVVSLAQLLESGVHFGHQTRPWNPKMDSYIFRSRNGDHIIDLVQTAQLMEEAYDYVRTSSEQGKRFLFVGTKRQAAGIIAQEASRCGAFYINQRWLGGMLTNWVTIKSRVDRLKELERRADSGQLDLLPKKEASVLRQELDKLQKYLGGIKNMRKLPDAVVIVDQRREYNAVLECQKLGIPTISIMDAGGDPDLTDISIPANDNTVEAIKLIVSRLADAINEGKSSTFANEELDEIEEEEFNYNDEEFNYNDNVDFLDVESSIELDETSNAVELEGIPEQAGDLYLPVTNKIDPYLLHSFEALEESSLSGSIEDINEEISKILLPMMVRVSEVSWNPADIPDCQLVFQLGDIFAISGTLRTLAFLHQDPKVISVDASRPGMTWDSSISESTVNTLEISTSEVGMCSRVCSENISLIQVNAEVLKASLKFKKGHKNMVFCAL